MSDEIMKALREHDDGVYYYKYSNPNKIDEEEVYFLRMEGFTFKEIADEMGFSPQGVQNAYNRVLRKLRHGAA